MYITPHYAICNMQKTQKTIEELSADAVTIITRLNDLRRNTMYGDSDISECDRYEFAAKLQTQISDIVQRLDTDMQTMKEACI